jgi:GNAT superfamily N-acetyltransferase
MAEVVLRPVSSGASLETSELLKIYEDVIPASERKSSDSVMRMLDRANYLVLGAFAGSRLVGFLVAHAFQQQPLYLLEYMAVSKDAQGHGIGSRLFSELVAVTTKSSPLLLEVDSDRFSSSHQQQRIARKRFYRRLGCREVAGLTYELPLLGDPPPMDLLVHWPGQQTVPRTMIEQWITALYVEVYGQSDLDPRISTMVDGLPDQVCLV